MISASDLKNAFPEVNPGIKPLGPRVLVQLRLTRDTTDSGIHIVRDTKEFNDSIAQFAKVISLGRLAFKDRSTAKVWPEGMWAEPGDIVRVPKYGGDRFAKKIGKDTVIFVIFDDKLINAVIDEESFTDLDELL
jgi:co-chaperonin GroES (HSP10)